MSRFLFVVPPLAGHINPTVSIGRELARRGHTVAWAGLPGAVEDLLPGDAPFLAAADEHATARFAQLRTGSRALRGAAAFKFMWDAVLVPLGYDMIDGLESILESWGPDVIVADQQALAGAAVARKHGVRWATSAATSAELTDPLVMLPRAESWVAEQIHQYQRAVGITAVDARRGDLRFSEHLVLVYSTLDLIGSERRFPPHYAFVGPSISDRPEREPFPWDWLDPEVPHVLMTMGTSNVEIGARLYEVAADAFSGEALQAVVVAPPAVSEFLPPGSNNILVRDRVPQLALLRCVDAVVCHGGHNTVTESLATGVPLVLAPIGDDHPIIAEQVVRAGAGLRVRCGRVMPEELRASVWRVLEHPAHRRAAQRIKDAFAAAGGTERAADHLEVLSQRSLPYIG